MLLKVSRRRAVRAACVSPLVLLALSPRIGARQGGLGKTETSTPVTVISVDQIGMTTPVRSLDLLKQLPNRLPEPIGTTDAEGQARVDLRGLNADNLRTWGCRTSTTETLLFSDFENASIPESCRAANLLVRQREQALMVVYGPHGALRRELPGFERAFGLEEMAGLQGPVRTDNKTQASAGVLSPIIIDISGYFGPSSTSNRPGPLFDLSPRPWLIQTAAPAAPAADLLVVSTGLATGNAFEVRILNTGRTRLVMGTAAVALESVEKSEGEKIVKSMQDAIRKGGANATPPVVAMMQGYCLEYTKQPPIAGTVFRVANRATQTRFGRGLDVLRAAEIVEAAGKLTPDSDRVEYVHSIRQWAVWTAAQQFSAGQFEKEFVEHTKKNIQAAKEPWNARIEAALRALVPHRWQEISRILEQAHATTNR